MKIDRASIISAAMDLIEERGTEQLTLQLLAQKLGVKAPSLYNHIQSIQALREAVALSALETLEAELRDAAVGLSKDEALVAMARAFRLFAKSRPRLCRAMLELSRADGSVREEGRALISAMFKVLEPYGLSEAGRLEFLEVLP